MNRRKFLGTAMALGAGLTAPGVASAGPSFKLWVPPEEDRHELTFMQWPANRRVHNDPVFLEMLQQTIADIANAIVQYEPVVLLAEKAQHGVAGKLLSAQVKLWDVPTDDLWCRDSGPLIAIFNDGPRIVSHIQFNGWGHKQIHRNDGLVAEKVAERLGLERVPIGLTGEAGGVEHDGHGLLVAHESSWVNDNRNPGLSRDEIGKGLLDAYGADRILWSPGVRGEDITDYHIDSVARFSGPGKLLMNLPDEPDSSDPFHRAALQTHDTLKAAGLNIEVIPEPNSPRIRKRDFVASYVNYYVCNGAVIAAQFGDRDTDEIARKALARHYPDREVVMLNVDPLGEVGGGIHCATQQLPAA